MGYLYLFHAVYVEQTVGGVDELSPKCLELRVGRLLSFTEVRVADRRTTVTDTDRWTVKHTDRQTHTDRQIDNNNNNDRLTAFDPGQPW